MMMAAGMEVRLVHMRAPRAIFKSMRLITEMRKRGGMSYMCGIVWLDACCSVFPCLARFRASTKQFRGIRYIYTMPPPSRALPDKKSLSLA